MTRVLPEPAPARTSSGPSPWVTASRCWGLSPVRSIMDFELLSGSAVQRLRGDSLTAQQRDRSTAFIEEVHAAHCCSPSCDTLRPASWGEDDNARGGHYVWTWIPGTSSHPHHRRRSLR